MNLRVSGKHMEIGDSFRGKIEERIRQALEKYFDGGYSGQVTVEKTRVGYATDCLVRLDTGVELHTRGEAHEPVFSFDVAADRLEKRLRRYKRRLRDHTADFRGDGLGPAESLAYRILGNPDEEFEEELPEDYAPAIVAETTLALDTMSVAAAVIELDKKDHPVFVFRNAGNGEVNIVYRRPDGNIGWIDPSQVARRSGAQ
jgi:ribosomal subunit interface protein